MTLVTGDTGKEFLPHSATCRYLDRSIVQGIGSRVDSKSKGRESKKNAYKQAYTASCVRCSCAAPLMKILEDKYPSRGRDGPSRRGKEGIADNCGS
jgi:hypothetical protein